MGGKHLIEIVRVEWLDADHDSGWADYKAEKIEPTISFGVLVNYDEEQLVMSHVHAGKDGQWLGLHRIPSGMVIKAECVWWEEGS